MRLTFSLKALMAIVTLACLLSAIVGYVVSYRAWRASLYRDQGRFVLPMTFHLNDPDTKSFASKLRVRLVKLPGHTITKTPVDVGIDPSAVTNLPANLAASGSHVVDNWFFRIKLKDGSETQAAIWVRSDGKVDLLVYAWDTQPEVRSGVALKRCAERSAVMDAYDQAISDMEMEYLKSRVSNR